MASHYDLLGCSPKATTEEIHKAWLKASNETYETHKSLRDSSHQKIRALRQAWLVLSDAKSRSNYDEGLKAAQRTGGSTEHNRPPPSHGENRRDASDNSGGLDWEELDRAMAHSDLEDDEWLTQAEAVQMVEGAIHTHESRYIDVLTYSSPCTDLDQVARVHTRWHKLQTLLEEVRSVEENEWNKTPPVWNKVSEVRWESCGVEDVDFVWT